MDVGKRLIELRELCGYTQNGLADAAGVSQTHLRRVERGEADITIGHLELLCDAMNLTLHDFLKKPPEQMIFPSPFPAFPPSKNSSFSPFLKAFDSSAGAS